MNKGVLDKKYIDTVFMGKLVFHIFEKIYLPKERG